MLSQKVADFLHHLKDGGVHRRFFWRDHEAEILYWNATTYSRELLRDVFYELSDFVTPSLIHAIKMLNRSKDETLARRLHDLAENYERRPRGRD